MSDIPILITGAQRSGTTWVGRTVSQHPRVRYEHEPFNVSYPNPMFGLTLDTWYTHYPSSAQQDKINLALEQLLYRGRTAAAIARCKATGISRYTPLQFIKEYLMTPRQRILMKDPIALLSADWLHQTHGFQVICMIRSPLAFVASHKKANWELDLTHIQRQANLMDGVLSEFKDELNTACHSTASTDLIDRTALLWKLLHAVILHYQTSFPDWLYIRHEDLSATPMSGFEKIFSYLKLEMTTAVKNYISDYTDARNPAHASSTRYQPRDSKALLNAWQQILTPDEIDRVTQITSRVASAFYPPAEGSAEN